MSADKDNELMDPKNPNSPYNKYNWNSPYSILNPLSPHYMKSTGGSGDPLYDSLGGLIFIAVMVVAAIYFRFCV